MSISVRPFCGLFLTQISNDSPLVWQTWSSSKLSSHTYPNVAVSLPSPFPKNYHMSGVASHKDKFERRPSKLPASGQTVNKMAFFYTEGFQTTIICKQKLRPLGCISTKLEVFHAWGRWLSQFSPPESWHGLQSTMSYSVFLKISPPNKRTTCWANFSLLQLETVVWSLSLFLRTTAWVVSGTARKYLKGDHQRCLLMGKR